MTTPPPFVGFLMVEPDWAPPKRTKTSWIFHLPPLYYGLPDAQADSGGPYSAGKVPYEVTITFKRVEKKR